MLPQLFLDRMKNLLKEEYPLFLESLEQEPYKALRLNPLKGSKEAFLSLQPFCLKPVSWEQNGYYYEEEDRPGRHPYHEAGVYYIQEPSAMSPVPFLEARPGERILDLCAAPGGKSTQIAGYMRGEGLLVCNEIHPQRAKILSENVERMGIANVLVTNETPQKLAGVFGGFFDKILVDAPCSGEGMFRKNSDACEEWSEENVANCAARQDEVLDAAAEMLKPGGRLVYSTCTFAPAENEGSILRFLERHPDLRIMEVPMPEGFVGGRRDWVEESAKTIEHIECTMRLLPHKVMGEGHYIAVLERTGDAGEPGNRCRNGWEKNILKKDYMEFMEFAEAALMPKVMDNLLEGRTILKFGEQLYSAPDELPSLKGLKVLRPGLHLGTILKNRFEPSHALALFLKKDEVKQRADIILQGLDGAEGLAVSKYLTGQTLILGEGADVEVIYRSGTLETVQNPKGWCLVCVDGYSLGWTKITGSILKNHYPKGLRKA